MASQYVPQDFEEKWQKHWEESGIYSALDGDPRQKFYSLVMFPYPIGRFAHGTYARLHDLRCNQPSQAHARF